MRWILLFMCSMTIVTATFSQDSWGTLAMIETTKEYDPEFGIESFKAVISPITHAMNGKEIMLKGWIIPITGKTSQSHFMFSKFPQDMCFFCGKAGPETAIQVFMRDAKKVAFTTDKIMLKGILKIHSDQASGLLYTLDNGEILNIEKK